MWSRFPGGAAGATLPALPNQSNIQNYRIEALIWGENLVFDWIFILATGLVAYHGLTYRDENGETEWVHLLFGCIALLFCLRVLFVDIFELF